PRSPLFPYTTLFRSQMYSEEAIRGIRVPGGGHSTSSSADGLITAQFANDIVRDHKYTPSLLVRLNWCSWVLNQAPYAATGSAPRSEEHTSELQSLAY